MGQNKLAQELSSELIEIFEVINKAILGAGAVTLMFGVVDLSTIIQAASTYLLLRAFALSLEKVLARIKDKQQGDE